MGESAIRSQLTFGDHVRFSRQKTSKGVKSLPISVFQLWTSLLVSHQRTEQDWSHIASRIWQDWTTKPGPTELWPHHFKAKLIYIRYMGQNKGGGHMAGFFSKNPDQVKSRFSLYHFNMTRCPQETSNNQDRVSSCFQVNPWTMVILFSSLES